MGGETPGGNNSEELRMTNQDAIKALAEDYVPAIYKRIARHLETETMTVIELAKACHTCTQTINKALTKLRQRGVVYIAEWERAERGPFIKHYALGSAKDAPKPRLMTSMERNARYRAKGVDTHRARRIRTEMSKLPQRMTLAGMLGAA